MKVIKLAGLWEKRDKKGNLFLSGDLNQITRVVVVKNDSKSGEKDPDYYLCIGSRTKKDKTIKSFH